MATKRTALITGANRGIGLEVGRQLAAKGLRVFLASRELEKGKAAAASPGLAGDAVAVALDVTDETSIRRAAETVGSLTPSLDVLVNNAAIFDRQDGSVLDVTTEVITRTFRTNLIGPLLVARAFLPLLLKSADPRIINVSSGLGALSDMGNQHPAYSMSKTALNALTRQLSAALKHQSVKVNSVCPGWVRTDMGGANATRDVTEGVDTIVWLATDAPRDLTGKFLRDRRVIDW
jgi:NAD(P)-dependent dehydrogenase (short-subunit alcohol dehydrogenase family)